MGPGRARETILRKNYADLRRFLPPRPIHDPVDCATAVETTDAMALWHDDFTRDRADYFGLVCSLIEDYGARIVKWPKLGGVELRRGRIRPRKKTFSARSFAPILGCIMSQPEPTLTAKPMKPSLATPANRRQFLRNAFTTATAPLLVKGSVLGLSGAAAANSRIAFATFGIGNRARAIMPNFFGFKDVQWVAVCDARQDRLTSGKELVDAHYGNKDCKIYKDFRELLARKDVDALLIATGNRWHGLGSIYAARAGKDVYSEKPVTLTIHEGRVLVDTCRRLGTVYQAGTQRRATESYAFARDMIRQGKIGKLKTVEMQVWTGPGIPHEKDTPVPAGWDYDLWLGQCPMRPFNPARANNWQYYWDTAEGIVTDMGCHYTDQMQWVLDRDKTGPVEFEMTGVKPDPAKFGSETPLTAEARCRYADGVEGVIYQRAGFTDRYIKYIGSEGWIQVDDETDAVKAEPKSILSLRKGGGESWANASSHIRNFLDCIRSRRPTHVHPEVAHRAITICQAMNISFRLGAKLKWDPASEKFDHADANRMLAREPRAPWRI